ELAGEQYELPRAEPAQPAVFGRVRLVAGQPGGGYWSRVVGKDQTVLPARAPPARDGAGTGDQVGAAQGEVAFVPAGGFVVPVLGVCLFEAGAQQDMRALQCQGGATADRFALPRAEALEQRGAARRVLADGEGDGVDLAVVRRAWRRPGGDGPVEFAAVSCFLQCVTGAQVAGIEPAGGKGRERGGRQRQQQ